MCFSGNMFFYERIKKKEHEIAKESRLGTAFAYVLDRLKETSYRITYRVLNSANYGSPQKRLRLIILGSRDGNEMSFPEATHEAPGSITVLAGHKKPWVPVRDAICPSREIPNTSSSPNGANT